MNNSTLNANPFLKSYKNIRKKVRSKTFAHLFFHHFPVGNFLH